MWEIVFDAYASSIPLMGSIIQAGSPMNAILPLKGFTPLDFYRKIKIGSTSVRDIKILFSSG
jgi:hypothetical protein